MASLHSIFQDIALIISANTDEQILRERIRNNVFDWEKIVPVASSHLIIPLLYFKLKDKNVFNLLPKDLRSYLEEIARQNTERNKTILQEIQDLSLLLRSENIEHVFLKGAAMLVSGIYPNIGERMIGDIDILVNYYQCLEAQELLLNNGYTQNQTSLTDKYFEQKHLPRLIPQKKTAAVEIHRRILHKPIDEFLQSEGILKNKIFCNGIYISDNHNLYLHSILNFEINDKGYHYNYLGLRNTCDAALLMNELTKSQISTSAKNKYFYSFINKAACYFKLNQLLTIKTKPTIKRKVFILKQKYEYWNRVHFFIFNLLDLFTLIFNRSLMLMTNPSYRQDSFRKRNEILKFIKSRLLID